MLALSTALSGILARCHRIREHVGGQEPLHVPFRRPLRRPGPENPPTAGLVRIQLCLDEASNVGLRIGRQSGHFALAESGTASNVGTSWIGAVVACTNSTTVEVLGAVRHRTCPLTDNGPLIHGGKLLPGELAHALDMFVGVLRNEIIEEDLIVVIVHHDLRESSRHKSVPKRNVLKAVVQCKSGILVDLANSTVGIVIELLQGLKVNPCVAQDRHGLIQRLNCRDNVRIARVSRCQQANCVQSSVDVRLVPAPVDASSPSTVVESILRSRRCQIPVSIVAGRLVVVFTYPREGLPSP